MYVMRSYVKITKDDVVHVYTHEFPDIESARAEFPKFSQLFETLNGEFRIQLTLQDSIIVVISKE